MYLVPLLSLFVIWATATVLGKLGKKSQSCGKSPSTINLIKFLIGFALSKKNSFQTYDNWKRKYGDIFQLQLFGFKVVVINELHLAKACFSNPDCLGTLLLPFHEKMLQERERRASTGDGILVADFKSASEQRKFFIKSFADFGQKTGTWKEQLKIEVSELIADLRNKEGQPFVITRYFAPFFCKATSRALGNDALHDKIFTALEEAVEAGTRFSNSIDTLGLWLPNIVLRISNSWRDRLEKIVTPSVLLNQEIAKQSSSRIPGQPRHFIDAYMDKQDSTLTPSSSFHASKSNLSATLTDILFGALDTASATLEWILLLLLTNEQAYVKLQREIDSILGRDRLPDVDDRAKMPFTEACILETLRLQPIVPFTSRVAVKDVEINGYSISKGALLTRNCVAINRDPNIWEDPCDFLPERFLCPKTGLVSVEKRKLLNTFNTGPRACPGRQIALDSLFVFVTSLFQNFHIVSDKKPFLIPVFGIVTPPMQRTKISFKTRK